MNPTGVSTEPTVNIAAQLPAMAASEPHRMAVVFPVGRDRQGRVSYTHLTYQQLDQRSNRIAAGLLKLGIGKGVRVVLMVPPSLDFFAISFALLKVGAVMVCVDPGMGTKNLGTCLAEAQPQAFIGIPKAHWARKLLGWAKSTISTNIVVGGRRRSGPTVYDLETVADCGEGGEKSEWCNTIGEDLAAILFTSGSTGVPKGVIYTHNMFGSQVEALRQEYGIEPGEIDLATFPLFALFAPALGMTAIIPDMDFTRPGSVDPKKIIEAVENFGATNMFGSPALLKQVGRWGVEHGVKFPSLRRILSAGAPVPAQVLAMFQKMLAPGVEVFTPYGATESLPVCSIGSEKILAHTAELSKQGKGVCVGRPVGDIRVKIIKITDEPIDQWTDDLVEEQVRIGEIVVKGSVVTRAYFNRPESTKLAKIVDPSGGFYHRMGDLGYFDDHGDLWFCGRKSQRVVTDSGTLFTTPCEEIFNAHHLVERSALVAVRLGGTIRPVLCVELTKNSSVDSAAVRREILELAAGHDQTRDIKHILDHPEFPVDIRHNAKIGREELSRWAQRKLR